MIAHAAHAARSAGQRPSPRAPRDEDHAPDPRIHDLRRSHPRDAAEGLLLRAEVLPPSDRTLIGLVYREGFTTNTIAAMGFGPVRTVRRRVHKLVRRMLSPEFAFVALHAGDWPPTRRAVARAYFLHGLPMGEVARELGITYYAVRRHHDAIRALCDETIQPRRAPSKGSRA